MRGYLIMRLDYEALSERDRLGMKPFGYDREVNFCKYLLQPF